MRKGHIIGSIWNKGKTDSPNTKESVLMYGNVGNTGNARNAVAVQDR